MRLMQVVCSWVYIWWLQVTDFVGRNVKEADNDICAALKARGRLFNKATCTHSYPFCWRSETPLIYR